MVALSLVVGVPLALPKLGSTPMAPSSCWLGWNLTLGHIGEFVRVTKALAFLAPILVSLEIINTLLIWHPPYIYSPCFDSLLDF